jgi:hypothetical protein
MIDGVVKIGCWPKTEGLAQAMRYLGLFERDNRQQSENLSLQVLLVGAPTKSESNPVAPRTRLTPGRFFCPWSRFSSRLAVGDSPTAKTLQWARF